MSIRGSYVSIDCEPKNIDASYTVHWLFDIVRSGDRIIYSKHVKNSLTTDIRQIAYVVCKEMYNDS